MGNSRELRKIQNRIYKIIQPYTSKRCRDNAWENVMELYNVIRNVDGVVDAELRAGVYYNYINKARPNDPAYRDYKLKVKTDFGILSGYIRCHAAGTMDDEFSTYDMTISLYPDREATFEGKRLVISARQLNEIMDNQKIDLVVQADTPTEMGNEAKKQVDTAKRNGIDPNKTRVNVTSPNNNTPNDAETVIGIDPTKNNIKDAVASAAQNYGGDLSKVVISGNVEDTNESKSYTKRQVEEARLAEMRRTGTVMTKKELRESFVKNNKIYETE